MIFAVLSAPSTCFAQERPSDEAIAVWIVDALREDPRVRFSDIQVSSQNGVVRLTGSVFSLAESQYARLSSTKQTLQLPQRQDSGHWIGGTHHATAHLAVSSLPAGRV